MVVLHSLSLIRSPLSIIRQTICLVHRVPCIAIRIVYYVVISQMRPVKRGKKN